MSAQKIADSLIKGTGIVIALGVALAELAEQLDVHPNQINPWRRQMLDNAASVFGSTQDQQKSNEAHIKDLHTKLGQLTLVA